MAAYRPAYALLLLLIGVSGLGSALYHPEAAKTVAFFSGARRGSGMSLFSVGGNIGFAVGPGLLLLLLGRLHGVAPLALLAGGGVMAALLWRASGRLGRGVAHAEAAAPRSSEPIDWTGVLKIIALVTLRSWIHMGLVYYLPYWAARTAGGVGAGSYVSAFLFAGALGTLVGGPMGDRFGRRLVVRLSLLPLTPLLLLFLALRGVPALAVIAVCGFLIIASFSVTMVMSQELMARKVGMASGLTNGFAIGMGGLGVLAIGALADHLGLDRALLFIALLPLPTLGLSAFLPDAGRAQARSVAADVPPSRPAAAR